MKKVFVDCGFYGGKAWELFKKNRKDASEFIAYGFDPMLKERNISKWKERGVELSDKAVWICDGEIEFFSSKRRQGRANSLFHNLRCKEGKEKTHTVYCIDFSKWILDNFDKEDYIVLKMDIEGAEYEVLDKMIKDGSIDYIDKAYIEFHAPRREDTDRSGELSLRKRLREVKTLDLNMAIEWTKR
jgi:FkbM family methyltransferase